MNAHFQPGTISLDQLAIGAKARCMGEISTKLSANCRACACTASEPSRQARAPMAIVSWRSCVGTMRSCSDQRANTVRDYLVEQGVPAANVTAVGFGVKAAAIKPFTICGLMKN